MFFYYERVIIIDRLEVLKLVPIIKNEDVIVYDPTLKNLLDKDVLNEYNTLLAACKINKKNYDTYVLEVKEYEKMVDDSYFYNPKWNEQDYFEALKIEKSNYNALYGGIKKIENNIEVLQKKYNTLNEQIELQIRRDEKEMNTKRENIDKIIKQKEEELATYKKKFADVKIQKEYNEEKIKEINEEAQLINDMLKELDHDEFKCKYCNSTIKRKDRKEKIFSMLTKQSEKLIDKNEKHSTLYKKNIDDFNFYGTKIKETTTELKNAYQFKKNDYNFYMKKSVEVLKLEAKRDETLNNINKFKKEISGHSETKSKEFLNIKDKISKLELSLENMQKIKIQKDAFKNKYAKIDELKKILSQQKKKLDIYKKFLIIYFKICEQKINDYFGPDFKFKLYKFKDYDIEEVLEVTYKTMAYEELTKHFKYECDKIYKEKIGFICS